MYQISLSLQRIEKPQMDLQKAHRSKLIVYGLAIAFSCVFTIAVTFFVGFFDKKDEFNQRDIYMYTVYILAYSILPVAYFLTLCKLQNSMIALKQQSAIQEERRSVVCQFLLFLVSFVSRSLAFVIQILVLKEMGQHSFAWQMTNLIMYIPWNILPIGYILWCHQRTYALVLFHGRQIQHRNGSVSSIDDKQLLNEVVCEMAYSEDEELVVSSEKSVQNQ